MRTRHAVAEVLAGGHIAYRDLAQFLVAGGLLYGAVMGSFSVLDHDGLLRMLFSAVKVPLLLAAIFALCVPSFFVLNTLLGVRDDFPISLRAVVATQATVAITLAALAPLTGLVYLSSADYRLAQMVNGAMFFIASMAGQINLRRRYRRLIATNPIHSRLLRLWLVQYVFVGIQLGWSLRPFIGSPELPLELFREESLTNAYVALYRLLWP